MESSCSPTRRSLRIRPASGRRIATRRAGRNHRSTSSTCATTASPGPELPEHIVIETRAKYIEAFERLTGISFEEYVADPEVVLR